MCAHEMQDSLVSHDNRLLVEDTVFAMEFIKVVVTKL
jgi:hypothetical protein